MSLLAQGLLIGALFGLGLALMWRGLPLNRRHSLADRVVPYLLDQSRPSTLLRPPTSTKSIWLMWQGSEQWKNLHQHRPTAPDAQITLQALSGLRCYALALW